MFKPLSIALLFLIVISSSAFAQVSEDEQGKLDKIKTLVDKAGSLFVDGDYKKSASRVRSAQAVMSRLARSGNADLMELMAADHKRIMKAVSLLEDQGMEFKTFGTLEELAAAGEEEMANAVSFTKHVAPIIVARCGTCHVRGNRGKFSAASFKALKKGTPDGAVIKDGDPAKSSFVKLIESGAMPPRAGGIPEEELQIIKDWISQGAKFDGEDQEANVTTFAQQGSGNKNGSQTRGRSGGNGSSTKGGSGSKGGSQTRN